MKHLIKYAPETETGGTPAPTQTPAAGASAGSAQPSWYDGFKNEENKNLVLNKKFQDVEALADSYRNLEKLRGLPQERTLVLPEKADDKAGWDQVYEKLGKPKDGKYSFEAKPDVTGKDTFGDWAKSAFAEANLTDAQAKIVVEKYRSMTDQIKSDTDSFKQNKLKTDVEDLRKEWGNAYDQNNNIARAAKDNLGMTEGSFNSLVDAVGAKQAMQFLKGIGEKMGEGQFRGGEGKSVGFGKMDPASAKAEISMLRKDSEFTKKLATGDQTALRKWTQLHQDAAPGETRT